MDICIPAKTEMVEKQKNDTIYSLKFENRIRFELKPTYFNSFLRELEVELIITSFPPSR